MNHPPPEKAHRINDWLKTGTLGELLREAEKNQRLHAAFNAAVPAAFKGLCRASKLEGSCLIAEVQNASALTLLRFESPNLLAVLRQNREFAFISTIKWRLALDMSC